MSTLDPIVPGGVGSLGDNQIDVITVASTTTTGIVAIVTLRIFKSAALTLSRNSLMTLAINRASTGSFGLGEDL